MSEPSPIAARPDDARPPASSPAASSSVERLSYRRADIFGDYARGGGGAVLSGAPLLAFDPHWIIALVLAGAFGLFGLFLGKTWQRHRTRVLLDETGVAAVGPLGRRIDWDRLDGLVLKFYSTKRDRSQGWMILTLRGDGRKLALESSLDGFEGVVERAADAARRNGVQLSDATVGNLAALGIVDEGRD